MSERIREMTGGHSCQHGQLRAKDKWTGAYVGPLGFCDCCRSRYGALGEQFQSDDGTWMTPDRCQGCRLQPTFPGKAEGAGDQPPTTPGSVIEAEWKYRPGVHRWFRQDDGSWVNTSDRSADRAELTLVRALFDAESET